MELQKGLADYERAGVSVFAISYDPVATLAEFAERRGISYPLLSDVGSVAIERIGLLNQHVEAQHAHYGVAVREHHKGIPYPGTFALDEDGVVQQKWFEQSYRNRPSAVALLQSAFAAETDRAGAQDQTVTEHASVAVWMGDTSYHPYQRLIVNLGVEVAPGLHIYGEPIPTGYVPLSVTVDPMESLEVGLIDYPPTQPFRVEGLDEEFNVFEGNVRAKVPITLYQNVGEVTLTFRVRYQACSDQECFMPAEVELHLQLSGEDNIRD